MKIKRVLLYNWTPLQQTKFGGGVAVYMRNLLQFAENNKNRYNIEFVFLSSGFYYDSVRKGMYIRRESDYDTFENYTIVNSPIIAPLALSISTLKRTIYDKMLTKEIDKFIQEHGPFDIVHFQSFEGISSSVLKLKMKYRDVKFFHSIHDYGIICPDIRLWNKQNENCLYSQNKFQCNKCVKNHIPFLIHVASEASRRSYEYTIPYLQLIWSKIIKKTKNIFHKYIPSLNAVYIRYRETNIKNINKYSDGELCVSKRVAEIAKSNGIISDKIIVDYIGTLVAEKAQYSCSNTPYSKYFTILYMGYMNIEKGFYEYLNAIERISPTDAKSINLKFATRITDERVQNRIDALRKIFHEITIYDGYTHSDFPMIFNQVNLGICSPLWEDNLPQVALEMVSHGIPILTSTNGGAQELNNHPDFKYINNLEDSILHIMQNRSLLESYWEYAKKLTTMEEHMDNLIKIWTNS